MNEIWDRVTNAQPVPDLRVVLVTGAVAVVLVLHGPTWRFCRQAVTIVHEGGHALVAVLAGRSLGGVRLHRDSSGVTTHRGVARGPGMIATMAAGYPAPALLGLIGAFVLGQGYAVGLLWLLLLVLALLIVAIRNWFGLWVVLVSGGALFAVTWWAPGDWQVAFAHGLVWFLLLAAPMTVVELAHQRRHRRGAASSDADQLGRATWLPGWSWVGLFFLFDVGCLALGGALLLGRL
ncbi:MAG: M50 family metallopeptidase [Nocardioides sp.]|nr:M50 family metallopeptidase [Nocardioides sp.]